MKTQQLNKKKSHGPHTDDSTTYEEVFIKSKELFRPAANTRNGGGRQQTAHGGATTDALNCVR
jgi:hypothetical protein